MKESMRVRVDTADGGGDEQTLDVNRSMTLIVHPGMMEVTALDDDVMTITAENTVARTRQLTLQQWDELRVAPGFVMLFKHVFDSDPPTDLLTTTVDVRHVVGLIILMTEAVMLGKVPFIKLPETYLHPRHQANLADMLAQWSGNGKDI